MSHKRIGVRRDIVELISSEEADRVTPLMTKIHYRLLIAPPEWWKGSEALRIRGSARAGVMTTPWAELINWLGCPRRRRRRRSNGCMRRRSLTTKWIKVGAGSRFLSRGYILSEGLFRN
jgi:hypothetical protein